MQFKKAIVSLVALSLLALGAAGCGGGDKKAEAPKDNGKKVVLKVGATPVPHAEILNFVKPQLAKEGVDLQIVEFTDYVKPNLSLADKELDANYFQHIPYLEKFAKDRNLKLVVLAKVHIEPMGVYSRKIKDLKDVKDGAKVGIPNDPTNGGRSLLVLAAQGLIKVKDPKNVLTTVHDVTDNPHHFQFIELEAAAIPRSLDDVTCAAINTTYALNAGLNPDKDPIIKETADSLYVNIVAVREDTLKDPRLKIFQEAYQSPENAQFIRDKFKGSAYVGWKEK